MTATLLAPSIVSDPAILAGYPTIEGTRLEAAFVGELHRRGASRASIMRSYRLTEAQVDACVAFWAGVKWQRARHKGRRKPAPDRGTP